MEEGERMSREAYTRTKSEMGAQNLDRKYTQEETSDEDEDEGPDSSCEDPAPEGTGSLVQAMLAQAHKKLQEGADGKDLPDVPPRL